MTSSEPAAGSSSSDTHARQDWKHSDHIKRESRHIYNKLHSISYDSAFVHRIQSLFPSLLLTANLRCGAWYTDPTITPAVSYFKSTDGHTHQWGFSLKRSNLHLVRLIVNAGGAIIVDSTRRGKSMPDALSKTIPIWCAVLNQASRRRFGCPRECEEGFQLGTPKWMIPPTEHDQIRARIDDFVESLLDSDLEVPKLDRPLRPVFVTPQTELDTLQGSDRSGCTPIVLVSASRFVSDSADIETGTTKGSERAGRDFVYVQGAGDDHENWARGLTPDVFWKHQAQLLQCEKAQLEALVDSIVAEESRSVGEKAGHWFTPISVPKETDGQRVPADAPTNGADFEVGSTGVFIGSRTLDYTFPTAEIEQYALILHFTKPLNPVDGKETELSELLSAVRMTPEPRPKPKVLELQMSANKKGLSALRTVFPSAIQQAHHALMQPSSDLTGRAQVLICCQDGKDLSGSLAIAILASCFNDQRQLILDDNLFAQHTAQISKDTTKRRLQWLVSANPRAAPSRAFLLRINELLISPRHRPPTSSSI
ncbi:tRNA a64-2'-O-ribosylphosphate transferase [Pseudozyma hubeiensis SY62]|uniref:tRNA a64-2'-O-ribosylphosphate transferase n=1 Tax=Pseudozyma hubeiensis (strain SY62) TaxID=1305764 RepID=R9PDR6_PSEHS|nr:tRNA a64-2'-O-ribosylphosphate transferase [Pseudozyma hubeiensis SY62]GAC96235.1 tRNA a64-2'-O-ribosylphosphate transferase [Pseudozyma hubeiensis SY62]